MSTDLARVFITPTAEHLNRLIDTALIQTPSSEWKSTRPPNWLTTLEHARQQKDCSYKTYVILVEMLDNDWFGERLMTQETLFIQKYFLDRLRVQLRYHVVGVRSDGEKFTTENYSKTQRHVKFFVALMRSTYVKM